MKRFVRGIAVMAALASLSPLCAKEIKRKIKPGKSIANHGADQDLDDHQRQRVQQGSPHCFPVIQILHGHFVSLQSGILRNQIHHRIISVRV